MSILLIDPEGKSLGQLTMDEANKVADNYGLDLVEVRPGTYKLLDAGKLAYEASKRKQVKAKPVKEMKFKLNIGDHDYRTKTDKIVGWLVDGNSVKVTIWFSGREVSRPEAGIGLMERIAETVGEIGTATISRELAGKNMYMSITPGVKK